MQGIQRRGKEWEQVQIPEPRSHQSSTEVEQGELPQLEPHRNSLHTANPLLSLIPIYHHHFLHDRKSNLTGKIDLFFHLLIHGLPSLHSWCCSLMSYFFFWGGGLFNLALAVNHIMHMQTDILNLNTFDTHSTKCSSILTQILNAGTK